LKLKKMIVLRCLRLDRVIFSIRNFIQEHVEPTIRKDFMESRPSNL